MAERGKIYQITVQGTRTHEPILPYEYHITAENQDDAEATAKYEYGKIYPNVEADVTEVSLKSKWNKWNIAAIVCLFISCVLGQIHWGGVANIGDKPPLEPKATTMMMAVIIYSAFIVRIKIKYKGLKESFNGVSNIVLMFMSIWFCASFLNVFLRDITIPVDVFGITVKKVTISGTWIFLLAALFSWLSMSAVAGIIWVVLFLFSINNILQLDKAMGVSGAVYVLSAFGGIFFQIGQESAYFLKSLKSDLLGAGARSVNIVRRDIVASANAAKCAATKVVDVVATAATGVPINSSNGSTNTSAVGKNTHQ